MKDCNLEYVFSVLNPSVHLFYVQTKIIWGKGNNIERKFVVRFNKSNESCIMIDQVILIKLLIFFKECFSYAVIFVLSVKYEKKYKVTLYNFREMKFFIFLFLLWVFGRFLLHMWSKWNEWQTAATKMIECCYL